MATTFEIAARIFVYALEAYAACGLLFAVLFVIVGIKDIDPAAVGTGVGFRFLILPGVAAFWPMFLKRWVRGAEPPTEKTAHR
jgi:hypothetical protein